MEHFSTFALDMSDCGNALETSAFELDAYVIQERIGRGTFSDVHKATHKITGALVALKCIDCTRVRAGSPMLERELAILRAVHHRNIIALIGAQHERQTLYIALEYCADGDLSHAIRRCPAGLGLAQSTRYGRQLLSALHHLHEREICHRDLKPQNILLHKNEVKLSDFGLSRMLGEHVLAETSCGSPLYMAPEILHGAAYTNKADLWSLGCVLYEMLFGTPPYGAHARSVPELLRAQRNPLQFPRDHACVTAETKLLITLLLQREASRRVDWSALLQSRHWLRDSHDSLESWLDMDRPIALDTLCLDSYAEGSAQDTQSSLLDSTLYVSLEEQPISVSASHARSFHLSTSPSRWLNSTWSSLKQSMQDAVELARDLRESAQ